MHFLVNAFFCKCISPKRLDVAIQILQVHRSYDVEGTEQHLMWP